MITANSYDGRDILSIVVATQLLAFAIALYNAVESGDDYSGLTFQALIDRYYDESLLEDARIKFSSPGRYGLRDRDSCLTLFINAIVGLALAGQLAACGAAPGELAVANSDATDPAKAALISEMVQNAASSAGGSALKHADHHGTTAKRIDMSTPAEIK